MADAITVVEGPVKIKENKKWKSRWCVIRKLSPAADRLHIAIHKDAIQSQNKGIFPCQEFFTFQRGERVTDKERYVIAITCVQHVVMIAFSNKSMMMDWEDGIRNSLGRDHEFSVALVSVPSQSKFPSGPAVLHIQPQRICLTSSFPPKFYGAWNMWDIKKYGIQKDKFIFEAGPRSGVVAGVYILSSLYCEEINTLINQCGATYDRTWPDPQPGLRQVTRRARIREQLDKIRPISMTASVKDFTNTQVNADVNFRSNDQLESGTLTSIENIGSIENILKERLMSQCDVPKRRSRSLETKDSEHSEESRLRPPAKLPPKPTLIRQVLSSSVSVPMGLSARGVSPSGRGYVRYGVPESEKNLASIDKNGGSDRCKSDQSWAGDVFRAVNLEKVLHQSSSQEILANLNAESASREDKISVPNNANVDECSSSAPTVQGETVPVFLPVPTPPHFKEDGPPPLPPKVNSVQKDVTDGADCNAPHDYFNLAGNQDQQPTMQDQNHTTQSNAKTFQNSPSKPGPKTSHPRSSSLEPNHPRSNSDSSDQKSYGCLRQNMSVPNMRQTGTKSFRGRLEEIDLRGFDDREKNYMYDVKINKDSIVVCSDTNIAAPKPQKVMNHSYINLPQPLNKLTVPPPPVPLPPSPTTTSVATSIPSPTTGKVHIYQNVPSPTPPKPEIPEKPEIQNVPARPDQLENPEECEKPQSEKRHSYVNLPPADSDIPISDYLEMQASPEPERPRRTCRPANLVIKTSPDSTPRSRRPSSPLEYIDMKGVDTPTSPDYLYMGNGSEAIALLSPDSDSAFLDYVPMQSPVTKELNEDYFEVKSEDYLEMKSKEPAVQGLPCVPSTASFKKLRKLSDNYDSGSSSQMSLLSRDLYPEELGSNNYINVPEDDSLLKRQSVSSISSSSTWTPDTSRVQGRGKIGRSQSVCIGGSSPKRHSLMQFHSMEGELDDELSTRPLSSIWKKPPSPGPSTKCSIDSRDDRKENIPTRLREPFNNLIQPHVEYSQNTKGKPPRPLSTSSVEPPSPKPSSGKPSFFSRLIRRSTKDKKKCKSQEDILDTDKNEWVVIEAPLNAPQPPVTQVQLSQRRSERTASLPIRHVQTSPTRLSSAADCNVDSDLGNISSSPLGQCLSSSAEHQYHYIDIPCTTPPKNDAFTIRLDRDNKFITSITDSAGRLGLTVAVGGLRTLPEESNSRFQEVIIGSKKMSTKATPTPGRQRAASQPIPITSPAAPPPLPPRKISVPASPTVQPNLKPAAAVQQQKTPPNSDYAPIWKARSYLEKRKDSAKSCDVAENNAKSDNKIGSTSEIADCIDNLSLSSHSSDTTSLRGEEAQRASPAATVLRPRSGKEYLKVDRKKLSEDISQPGPRTPTTPTGVFTFEETMMSSESPSRNCYINARGNHSPKSPDSTSSEGRPIPPRIGDPNYVGARDRDRVYMNMDMTPPGTPPSNSSYSVSPQPLEQTNPYLNYAELDLSPGHKHRPQVTRAAPPQAQARPKDPEIPIQSRPQSAQINYVDLELMQASKDNKKKARKPVQRASSIEYAQIDMVYTAALSKAGKEHAVYREDPPVSSLRRSESAKKTASPLLSHSGLSNTRKGQAGFFRDRKGSASTNT